MGCEKDRRFDVRFSEQNSTFNCGGGGGSGTSNYEKLKNKPSINGVQLYGDKTGDELGLTDKLTTESIQGFMTAGVVPLTKRIDGATAILNQIWFDRGAVILDYEWSNSKNLRVRSIFGYSPKKTTNIHNYVLVHKNSEDEPYELTFENAPQKVEANYVASISRSILSFSGVYNSGVLDIRLCIIANDENGKEIDRVYSDQYRFTITNGEITRTHTETIPTDGDAVTDIGLIVPRAVTSVDFGTVETEYFDLIPLAWLHDENNTSYIGIEDSLFENNNHISLVIRTGDGTSYIGPTYDKALDTDVQSDWDETDNADPAYILNKPPIKAGEGEYSIIANNLDTNSATGKNCIIGGKCNTASGNDCLIMGVGNESNDNRNIINGQAVRDDGNYSLAIGNTIFVSSGSTGVAIGKGYAKTLKISGEANATTYTYNTLPVVISNWFLNRQLTMYLGTDAANMRHSLVININTTEHTITLDRTLSATALSNATAYIVLPHMVDGQCSGVVGYGLQASNGSQFVVGQFNELDPDAAFIVANGDLDNGGPRNYFVVKKNGLIAGGVKNTVTGSSGAAVLGAYNDSSGWSSFTCGQQNTNDGYFNLDGGMATYCSSTGSYGINFGSGITGEIYISGEANATTYTYDALPSALTKLTDRTLWLIQSQENIRRLVTAIDTINKTVTVSSTISADAPLNRYRIQISAVNADLHTYSSTIGRGLQTAASNQFIVGMLNETDPNAMFIVGNGDTTNGPQNALVVKKTNSTVIGKNNTVTGTNSFVVGQNNTVSGDYDISVGGSKNILTGNGEIVLGTANMASGRRSITSGQYNRNDGGYNSLIGSYLYATANGTPGFAVGTSNGGNINITGEANATTYTYNALPEQVAQFAQDRTLLITRTDTHGYISVVTAIDTENNTITVDRTLSDTALSNFSVLIYTATSLKHYGSGLIGNSLETSANYQFVTGEYNALDSNAAFIIGNGDATNGPSNAFVVHKDGSAHASKGLSINTDEDRNMSIISLGPSTYFGSEIDENNTMSLLMGSDILVGQGSADLLVGGIANIGQTVYNAFPNLQPIIDSNNYRARCKISGVGSAAVGSGISIEATGSAAFGNLHRVTGRDSFSAGRRNYVKYDESMAIGDGLETGSTNQVVVGYQNDPIADDAFEVGYGAIENGTVVRSNAFRVTKTGDAIAKTSLAIDDGNGGVVSITASELAALKALLQTL